MIPFILLPPSIHPNLLPLCKECSDHCFCCENNIMFLYSRSCGRRYVQNPAGETHTTHLDSLFLHSRFLLHNVHVNIPQPMRRRRKARLTGIRFHSPLGSEHPPPPFPSYETCIRCTVLCRRKACAGVCSTCMAASSFEPPG